jgi:glutamine synthetase
VPFKPGLARFACDITVEGEEWPYDPRTILRHQLDKARTAGYEFMMGLELEYFLLRSDGNGGIKIADELDDLEKPCYDLKGLTRNYEFLTTVSRWVNGLGWGNYANDHEDANGQFEQNFTYTDALTSCDRAIFFRYMVHTLAQQQGLLATFMPKPFTDLAGSAMHTHLSLFEGDRNAFHDAADPMRLSTTGKQFIAGLLTHAREVTAVTNQTVNSYRRLLAGTEAPTAATWGRANRSALVRLPSYKPSKANSARIEVRSPDSACNPYLTFAVLLAAGLRGIEKGYELPPEAEDDVWSLTDTERRAAGYEDLPVSLGEALTAMQSSELVAETLGEHVFEHFLRNKWEEFNSYRQNVTPFELRRYLPGL